MLAHSSSRRTAICALNVSPKIKMLLFDCSIPSCWTVSRGYQKRVNGQTQENDEDTVIKLDDRRERMTSASG